MGLLRKLALYRHGRGLGVHSPYAYRMVRDVIRPKGRYYTHWRRRIIEAEARLPRKSRRMYRLVFHLIARHSYRGIRLGGGIEQQMQLVIRMADMRPVMGYGLGGYDRGGIVSVCESFDLRKGIPPGILAHTNTLLIRELKHTPGLLYSLQQHLRGGWIFTDGDTALLVSDDTEPLNVIKVKML